MFLEKLRFLAAKNKTKSVFLHVRMHFGRICGSILLDFRMPLVLFSRRGGGKRSGTSSFAFGTIFR